MKKLGLYIHIPFCHKKCNYCDFYSLGCASQEQMEKYTEALITQISNEAYLYKNHEIDTVFFGGGTPSLLPVYCFEKIANTIKKALKLATECEFSIEVNPGTVDKEKLECYKKCGVNRISIGMQSTIESELLDLGRIHTYSDFLFCYRLVRECGFDNVSIDLMYGLPKQDNATFISSLKKVIELAPEHISSYLLKIEKNTPFGKIKDTLKLPDDESEYEMYLSMCNELEKNGYMQYEISNFSKSGFRSRHNLKYWLSEEYIGFGPSAHSYFNGERYSYKPSISDYISEIEEKGIPSKLKEEYEGTLSKMDEYVMLKLRLSDGVDLAQFKSLFGIEFLEKYKKAEQFVKTGHLRLDAKACAFTKQGFFVSNYILSEIL